MSSTIPSAEPPCAGRGCWAGAPSVAIDGARVLLSYRVRSPDRRGFETRVATSDDGLAFTDVWRATAEQLAAESIERSAIVVLADRVRLYVSYVDRADRRWRIAVLEAERVEGLDPSTRRLVLSADDVGASGVKDPVVLRDARGWWMLASVTDRPAPDPSVHARGDAFASGHARSATGLAWSGDGLTWEWRGIVLEPRATGWDAWETRIAAVLPGPGGLVALYDGAATVAENYEERTGVAFGTDLARWTSRSVDGPALESPHATRALRYASALAVGGRRHVFFEAARTDGAHELRVSVAD